MLNNPLNVSYLDSRDAIASKKRSDRKTKEIERLDGQANEREIRQTDKIERWGRQEREWSGKQTREKERLDRQRNHTDREIIPGGQSWNIRQTKWE